MEFIFYDELVFVFVFFFLLYEHEFESLRRSSSREKLIKNVIVFAKAFFGVHRHFYEIHYFV